jgi:hypothetical protein
MSAHLLANSLFALLLLKPTPRRLFVAGIVGSIALTLHNPVPHALFALPWFVWLALQEKPFVRLAALGAGYLPFSILIGIGWFVHSGQLASDGGAVTDGVGSLHGVASAFAWPTINLLYARLVGVAKLMLWAAPCLFVLACAGGWRARQDARFLVLAAGALLTFLGYLFVWVDQGHGWGFRYFHSAWLVLPLFATAFLFAPSAAQQAIPLFDESPPATADLRTFVVSCALLSLVACVGLRALQIDEFVTSHESQLPHYGGSEPRVIIVAGVGFYPYDLVQNDPFLRSDVVRMMDLGAEQNAAVIQRHFSSYRPVYRDRHGEVWSAAPLSPAGAAR